MFKLILLISIVINLVNGHGHLREPPSRNPRGRSINELVTQGCNVNFHNTYFTNWDCSTVCGNFFGDSSANTYFPDTSTRQANVPVNFDLQRHNATRTYTSGQWIDVVDYHTDHPGRLRVKLCKLNGPNDVPTQACFDQNVLKFKSVDDSSLNVDEFTVSTRKTVRLEGNSIFSDQKFRAKLPDGLSGDYFVLQLTFWRIEHSCFFRNNLKVSVAKDYGEYCPHQTYLGCSDIRILPNPASKATYVPNPAKKRALPDKLVSCLTWFYEHNNEKWIKTNPVNVANFATLIRNNDPNPSANAIGLRCMVPTTVQDDKKSQLLCNDCVQNCADPSKVCPQYCLCRWYGDNSVKFF